MSDGACHWGQSFQFKSSDHCISLCREVAVEKGYKVIPMFHGHGIGELFYQPPDIGHVRK